MGKKDRYIYQLIKDGKVYEEGLVKDLAGKYYTSTGYIYHCFKNKQKLLKEFEVRRYRINEWKPVKNSVYYFVSHRGVLKDYFDEDNLTCLARYYCGNVFQTKDLANQHFAEIEHKLKVRYETT